MPYKQRPKHDERYDVTLLCGCVRLFRPPLPAVRPHRTDWIWCQYHCVYTFPDGKVDVVRHAR